MYERENYDDVFTTTQDRPAEIRCQTTLVK